MAVRSKVLPVLVLLLVNAIAPPTKIVPVGPVFVTTWNMAVPEVLYTVSAVPLVPGLIMSPLFPVTEIVLLATSLIKFGLVVIVEGEVA